MLVGHGEIGDSDVRALIQNLRPSAAAVGRFVNATLAVRSECVPESADVHDVGILRVYNDAADLTGVAQSDVGPGLTSIFRFINSIPGGQAGANVRFSRARVNYFGVGWSDCQRADRSDRLPVEDWLPHNPGISGLPHSAAHRAKIKGGAISGNSGHRGDSASAKWPDQTPLEPAVKFRRNGLRRGCGQNNYRN